MIKKIVFLLFLFLTASCALWGRKMETAYDQALQKYQDRQAYVSVLDVNQDYDQQLIRDFLKVRDMAEQLIIKQSDFFRPYEVYLETTFLLAHLEPEIVGIYARQALSVVLDGFKYFHRPQETARLCYFLSKILMSISWQDPQAYKLLQLCVPQTLSSLSPANYKSEFLRNLQILRPIYSP